VAPIFWPTADTVPVSLHSYCKLLCQLWWICLQPNATVKKFAIIFPTGIRVIPFPTYVHSYSFPFPICSFIPIPMRFPFPVGNLIPAVFSTGANRRPDRSNAESESSVDRQCSVDVCVRRSTCRRQRARQFVRNQNAKVERFTLTSAAMHDRPVV